MPWRARARTLSSFWLMSVMTSLLVSDTLSSCAHAELTDASAPAPETVCVSGILHGTALWSAAEGRARRGGK
jgi:hypothetical protein